MNRRYSPIVNGERCCSPSRGGDRQSEPATIVPPAGMRAQPATDNMVALEGGTFTIGSDDRFTYPDDGEHVREVEVSPFLIDRCALTNERFGEFAEATGFETEAERFGWSFVFGGLLPDDFPPTRGVAAAPWWRQVEGSSWRRPEGPQSDLEGRLDHPVVHLSWNDALAYCAWAGLRLPREAEWEIAARGGLAGKAFPWGDELEPGGEHRMNVWQGRFPVENTGADGYLGTCRAEEFPANGYGLHNSTGNVWEWVADRFSADFRPHDRRRNPQGPPEGDARVQKGGSYLCHHSYCLRYRVAARQANTPDSSAGNVGFRCAADV